VTRHLISVTDLEGRLEQLIDRAIAMKRAWKAGDAPKLLDGRALAMIFEKPSTRTRVSRTVDRHERLRTRQDRTALAAGMEPPGSVPG